MQPPVHLSHALALLKDIYEQQMPFDRMLGVKVTCLTADEVEVRIDMREELIGNFVRSILHGGAISAVLDLTGGLIASVELIKHLEGQTLEEMARRLTRIGTIDLRVDYLRAGKGEYFTASGNILRRGNKVAVVRTEMFSDRNLLIAAGTGTYLVG